MVDTERELKSIYLFSEGNCVYGLSFRRFDLL